MFTKTHPILPKHISIKIIGYYCALQPLTSDFVVLDLPAQIPLFQPSPFPSFDLVGKRFPEPKPICKILDQPLVCIANSVGKNIRK